MIADDGAARTLAAEYKKALIKARKRVLKRGAKKKGKKKGAR